MWKKSEQKNNITENNSRNLEGSQKKCIDKDISISEYIEKLIKKDIRIILFLILFSVFAFSSTEVQAKDFVIENTSDILFNITGDGGNVLLVPTFGNVGIGTITPGGKLDLRDGTFYLTDANMINPLTSLYDANSYGFLDPISATDGGLDVAGISDTDAGGLRLMGIIGDPDPTDTTPAMQFLVNKNNSASSTQAIGTSETAFEFKTGSTALTTILGGGNVGNAQRKHKIHNMG